MAFSLLKVDGGARRGELRVGKKVAQTPFFMPVATFGTGRGIGPQDYHRLGVQATISNAFLLSLKPGVGVVEQMGGLDRFTGFDGLLFTDSGGFQSSSELMFVKSSRNGIHLKSPYDGSTTILTPKRLIAIQESLGSDVAMVIDDMAPATASSEQIRSALDKTHAWAKLCKVAHSRTDQLLFAIVQGGYDAALRKESAEYLSSIGFDGYGIGGCAIGEPKPDMYRAIKNSTPYLPKDKPRYLMGVGSPPDIVQAVSLGVDCFDSIFPTRNARHNMIFTRKGSYQMEKGRFATDPKPLEEGCDCYTCMNHSLAYVRHLHMVGEAEGFRLRQVHNVHFMMRLMADIRQSIEKGSFNEFKEEFLTGWFKGKVPKLYR